MNAKKETKKYLIIAISVLVTSIFILIVMKLFGVVNAETDLYRWILSIIWYTPIILGVILVYYPFKSYVKKSEKLSEKALNWITVLVILPIFLYFDAMNSLFISNKILGIIGISTKQIADLAGLFRLDVSHFEKTGLPVTTVIFLYSGIIVLMLLIKFFIEFMKSRR